MNGTPRERGEAAQERLGVRVAFLVDEEQRGAVGEDTARRGA